MLRISALLLALFAAPQAGAVSVEIAIASGAFHAADADCEASYGGTWCTSGSWLQPGIEGTLLAELQPDGVLADIHGDIRFETANLPLELQGAGFDGSLRVVDGRIELHGDGDPGSIASFLEFENGVRLSFADYAFAAGANSFDGSELYLRGNSWDALAGQTRDDVNVALGMDLSAKIRGGVAPAAPIPEPASLGLIAAGGLIIGAALRRPLRGL
jgi:hypothetical protein